MAAVHAAMVDPFKHAKYDIHLGRSLTQAENDCSRYTSIEFNHKVQQSNSTRTTTITKTFGAEDSYTLTIRDEEDAKTEEHKYSGRRRSTPNSYALAFDSNEQHFTLEKVESQYRFNIVSAPWQTDATKLSKQYDQLDVRTQGEASPAKSASSLEEGYFGDDFEEVDSTNPFDYRHYLNGLPRIAPPSRATSRPPTPQFGTPAPRPTIAPPREINAATAGIRKPPPANKSQSLRNASAAVPKVHIERRASTKIPPQADADDEDGLIIEEDRDAPPAKRRNLGLLPTPSGGGPISLRAAAARSMSPVSLQSPVSFTTSTQGAQEAGSGSEEDGEDGDGDDDDVDVLELGSPALGSTGGLRRRDTLDIQAQMEKALVEDDDDDVEEVARSGGVGAGGGAPQTKRVERESESESEEE